MAWQSPPRASSSSSTQSQMMPPRRERRDFSGQRQRVDSLDAAGCGGREVHAAACRTQGRRSRRQCSLVCSISALSMIFAGTGVEYNIRSFGSRARNIAGCRSCTGECPLTAAAARFLPGGGRRRRPAAPMPRSIACRVLCRSGRSRRPALSRRTAVIGSSRMAISTAPSAVGTAFLICSSSHSK